MLQYLLRLGCRHLEATTSSFCLIGNNDVLSEIIKGYASKSCRQKQLPQNCYICPSYYCPFYWSFCAKELAKIHPST